MVGHKGWRELNVVRVEDEPTLLDKLLNRLVWGTALILIGIGLGYAWAFHHLAK